MGLGGAAPEIKQPRGAALGADFVSFLLFQAGLDRMSQGHMLADVVAIIGTCPPGGSHAPRDPL